MADIGDHFLDGERDVLCRRFETADDGRFTGYDRCRHVRLGIPAQGRELVVEFPIAERFQQFLGERILAHVQKARGIICFRTRTGSPDETDLLTGTNCHPDADLHNRQVLVVGVGAVDMGDHHPQTGSVAVEGLDRGDDPTRRGRNHRLVEQDPPRNVLQIINVVNNVDDSGFKRVLPSCHGTFVIISSSFNSSGERILSRISPPNPERRIEISVCAFVIIMRFSIMRSILLRSLVIMAGMLSRQRRSICENLILIVGYEIWI
jgi:hypothetical protein